jgi:hypothetical protein
LGGEGALLQRAAGGHKAIFNTRRLPTPSLEFLLVVPDQMLQK